MTSKSGRPLAATETLKPVRRACPYAVRLSVNRGEGMSPTVSTRLGVAALALAP